MSSICNNCGSTIPDGNASCPVCGAMGQYNNSAPAYNTGYGSPVLPMSGLAIGGFVVSLIGLIIFGIIMGLIGLGLSIPGLIQTTNGTRRGKGLAIAGLVISIIDVAFFFILLAIRL